MEANNINSVVNPHMKLPGAPVVTAISPPDRMPKVVLHSEYAATREFQQISKDIYAGVKTARPANRKKTPVSVWCAAGIIAAIISTLAFKFLKK
ncbi:MAG: hypothetical protein LBK53_07410 [Heliobacteriaceae bacterium]|nr:hypothetical protein [Heliobacteriaceae bacterium]